jgi:hypothetical protein
METVYDFKNELPHLHGLGTFLFFLVGGYIYYWQNSLESTDEETDETQEKKRFFGLVIFGICLLTSLVMLPIEIYRYVETRHNYRNLDMNEGYVSNYHAMPSSGHDYEQFSVNDIPFYFSDFDETNYGYNNAASLGGAIRNNLYVRIGYYADGDRNIILKLETRQE